MIEVKKANTKSGIEGSAIPLDESRLMYLYTLYDTVAQDSGAPWGAVNDSVALRQVCHLLRDNPTPEDYVMYKVGIYNPGVPCIEDIMMERVPFHAALAAYKEKIRGEKK